MTASNSEKKAWVKNAPHLKLILLRTITIIYYVIAVDWY